jgi:hypothetical protein
MEGQERKLYWFMNATTQADRRLAALTSSQLLESQKCPWRRRSLLQPSDRRVAPIQHLNKANLLSEVPPACRES